MSEPTKTLQEKLEQIGGCGDGGCIVHVRPGMHTNGGCRCNREPHKMSAVIYWHKQEIASQAQEIERLWGLVRDAYVEGGTNAALSFGLLDLVQVSTNQTIIDYWLNSKTYAALQPKDNDQ